MSRSLPQTLIALTLLLGLLAAQQLFSLPGGSALMRSVQDSLHAPWFFAVVVLLCWWFRARELPVRLLIVGTIAIGLAVVTELAQLYVEDRSASVGDLQRNLLGGVLGFVFAAALIRVGHDQPLLVWSLPRGVLAGLACLALAGFSAWQPWQELQLQRYRAELLPTVVDFADERSAGFISANEGSWFRFGEATSVWPEYSGRQVLRLTFGDEEYPTLYVRELLQRWASYQTLALDVFVLGDAPLPLTVAVQYEGSAGTSAYHEVNCVPGANKLSIARDQFVPDEATGLRVRDLLIYTTAEHAGRSVLLGAAALH